MIGRADNPGNTRVPTIAFRFEGSELRRDRAGDGCDHGIAIRFGDFHSRRLVEDLGESRDNGVVRVSMVHYNTVEQVDRLTQALSEITALMPEHS